MIQIREVSAAQTHVLRRAVLRDGRTDVKVAHPDDDHPEAFHLMAFCDGEPAGVVSCVPGAVRDNLGAGLGAGRNAWRLYQMGVAARFQKVGIGRRLIEEVAGHVRARGAGILWAMARDSAAGFYQSCGFLVVGGGYPGWNDIPHHTVIRDL